MTLRDNALVVDLCARARCKILGEVTASKNAAGMKSSITPSITFVLLSPTYGMHQYTADLAGGIGPSTARSSAHPSTARSSAQDAGARVRVVTTTTAPRDRYGAGVELVTPVTTHGTGFSREGLDFAAYRNLQSTIFDLSSSFFHFTGVHLWNVPLVYALRRRGARVVHTLHDLAPHSGVRHGGLVRLWNRLIIRSGATILVHGKCYREQLLREGVAPERVVWAPLLHGFWAEESKIEDWRSADSRSDVIFFGRIEEYKGVDTLIEAWRRLYPSTAGLRPSAQDADASTQVRGSAQDADPRLILAGQVGEGVRLGELPAGVEVRDRQIGDEEALELFRGAALLVLPYRDATQSALIGAAARLGAPSLVTRTGALPEYVVEGETGWVVPPADPEALAVALAEALSDRARLARMGAAANTWYNEIRAEEQHILTQLYNDRA